MVGSGQHFEWLRLPPAPPRCGLVRAGDKYARRACMRVCVGGMSMLCSTEQSVRAECNKQSVKVALSNTLAPPDTLRCPLLAATASSSTLLCCRGTACASELARKVCRINFSLPRLLPYSCHMLRARASITLSCCRLRVFIEKRKKRKRNPLIARIGRFGLTNRPPHRATHPSINQTAKEQQGVKKGML